jgi:DNA-binding NarL/FixJ family response regulator
MERELTRIGVLVADRQALFRHGLAGLVREAWPDWVCDHADSFTSVLDALAGGGIGLVLLDLDLPGMSGPESIAQLRAVEPACHVMVLAETDERTTILHCLSAGAQGFVLKSATPMQFLRAVETVLSGGVSAPGSLAGQPLRETPLAPLPAPAGDLDPVIAQFTDRQRDVFMLLAEGCATKTIARRLDLAVGTVKVHLAAIYRALGAHSRLEALAKARNGKVWPELAPPPAAPQRERPQRELSRSYLG